MGVAIANQAAPVRTARRFSARVLGLVLALHLIFAALATIWVVGKYSTGHKLTFRAGEPSPNETERALAHRVLEAAGAAFGRAMSGSIVTGRGTAINFFGIHDLSRSVVIMIDVSDSMFTRTGDAAGSKLLKHGREQSFQVVRDEAIALVRGLTTATRFDIIRWAGSAHAWQPELVFASDENKTAAIAHIENEVDYKTAKPKGRPGGTRHDYALELAFSLRPETIYMLTDGNATEAIPGHGLKEIPAESLFKIADAGQKRLPQRARLHTIYYLNARKKTAERKMLQELAARNGGQFTTVEAKNRQAVGAR